jgi:hypothetical protein
MSKQIVLIIVEGISEKNALEGILKVILQKENAIELVVYDGDILTSLNPIEKIIQKCKETLSINGFLASDIITIVQISDLDGCYIDDMKIIKKISGSIKYTETTIECIEVDSIVARNQNKRNSIDILRATTEISLDEESIPFKLYYNSCNLEHVLYDQKTLNKKQKTAKAIAFALEYDTREIDFIPFIEAHKLSKEEDDLWEYIKIDNNSLQKSSTLYFLFDEE